MFTLGVPYMFYHLTHRHVAMYESLEIYANDKPPKGGTPAGKRNNSPFSAGTRGLRPPPRYSSFELEDLWRRRVKRAGRNRAKNLYADFEYRWRYWKLILLAMKVSGCG